MRVLPRAAAAALLAASVVALGACGSDDRPTSGKAPSAAAPAPVPSQAAPRGHERIIRNWSDSLRRGNVAAASRLFALPATVENGTGPLVLDSRAQVAGFNESLPCGAKLLSAIGHHGYTIATFRLTERPGGDCGGGGGSKAATAFRIEDGKILEWLRVPVPPEQPPPAPRKPPPPDPEV